MNLAKYANWIEGMTTLKFCKEQKVISRIAFRERNNKRERSLCDLIDGDQIIYWKVKIKRKNKFWSSSSNNNKKAPKTDRFSIQR